MINYNELVALTMHLCAIPAPSNHEELRAQFCKKYFDDIGVKGAYIDEALNVVAPIDCDKHDEVVVIMAHTDTVFPDTDPFVPRVENGFLHCPGVGDDTVHLATLMLTVKSIVEKDIHPAECGLVFVANSGEEGLGNLKGVRKIMADYGKRTREFITLDHNTHGMVNSAVGSHRYKISVTSQGGHSFNAFGNSNSLEVISQLVCELYKVNVPKKENSKTTYNVGVISGGTSVNTIAQSAEMLFEYRSDDFECLSYMKQRFDAVIEYISGLRSADGVQIKVELVGERPCGKGVDAAKQTALENRCREVYKRICNNDLTTESGSTDCNIPLSMGIPSICIGVGDGKGTHTREERLDLSTIEKGSNAAYEVIMGYFGK